MVLHGTLFRALHNIISLHLNCYLLSSTLASEFPVTWIFSGTAHKSKVKDVIYESCFDGYSVNIIISCTFERVCSFLNKFDSCPHQLIGNLQY